MPLSPAGQVFATLWVIRSRGACQGESADVGGAGCPEPECDRWGEVRQPPT